VAETIWIRQLLRDLHLSLFSPGALYCENVSATYLAVNPGFHARTKHFEMDFHFVCERVSRGEVRVCYVSSMYQLADVFTKALSSAKFAPLRSKLRVVPPLQLEGAFRPYISLSYTDL